MIDATSPAGDSERPDRDVLWKLSPLELAAGMVPGRVAVVPLPTTTRKVIEPWEALVESTQPAVMSESCFVAFSGGCDSSLVLAAATAAARELGVELPVPVSMQFPGSAADEACWQRSVVEHLGLREWIRIPMPAGHDILGSEGGSSLAEHGVLWPPMVHTWTAIERAATGGTLLTGEGGDEVFGWHRTSVIAALRDERHRVSGRAMIHQVADLLPPLARRRYLVRRLRHHPPQPWLRPEMRVWSRERIVADELALPVWWNRHLAFVLSSRSAAMGRHNHRIVARQRSDVSLSAPLLDPHFVSALASTRPKLGFSERHALLGRVFEGCLPPSLLGRRDKAVFNASLIGDVTREFVDGWHGAGVDPELVDADALRRAWSAEPFDGRSLPLLQHCWLATSRVGD